MSDTDTGDTIAPEDFFLAVANPPTHLSKREAILAGATRVFLAHGYDGTSMERVAAESGAARRTLYNQFPEGKESLFRAMIERVWKAYPVMTILGDEATLLDPELALRRVGDAVVAFWTPPLAISFLRMVIAEGQRFPDLARDFFTFGKTPAMEAVRKYLEDQAAAGRLKVTDAGLAAKQFIGMINEPALWLRVIGQEQALGPEECRKIVDQAVAIFLTYYRY